MKKNDILLIGGLAAVAYLLFSQTSSAGVPGVNINTPGGGGAFQGPCQSPYVIGPSGCVLPAGGGLTTIFGGGSSSGGGGSSNGSTDGSTEEI